MGALIEGLVMSGLAMQAHASSPPGLRAPSTSSATSGRWSTSGTTSDPPLSHGFKVGLGSIAIAALYERLLARDLSRSTSTRRSRAWPRWDEVERHVRPQHTDAGLDEAAVEETKAKYVDARRAARRGWSCCASAGRSCASGCPSSSCRPSELRDRLRAGRGADDAVGHRPRRRALQRRPTAAPQMIRRRYTVLDLCNEAGILEERVDELFAPDGFWGRRGS